LQGDRTIDTVDEFLTLEGLMMLFKEESVKTRPPDSGKGRGWNVAPAGPVESSEIEPAISLLESLGFRVRLGLTYMKEKSTWQATMKTVWRSP